MDYSSELKALKKQIEFLRTVLFISLLAGPAIMLMMSSVAQKQVLRAKGIIVEDEKGRPSIMLGNPVPLDKRRKRNDLNGIVLLDSNGTDRLYLGSNGKLHMDGAAIIGPPKDGPY
jgi:hypothetical protein